MTTVESVQKANDLIKELGLGDEYGESGGLVAIFDKGAIWILDEAYAEEFPLSGDLWARIDGYLRAFASEGADQPEALLGLEIAELLN